MGRWTWERAITIAGLLAACAPAAPDEHRREPELGRTETRASLELSLPASPRGMARVSDRATGVGVSFVLNGARSGHSERSGDTTRFVGAGPDGGDIWHRLTRSGVEDDTEIRSPATRELRYRILLEATAGLRLVGGTLELLDSSGTPRVRVGPAFVKDASGRTVRAELALHGCAADRDPRGPWGREVTAPGATSCELGVGWQAGLPHPIVVDPPWQNPATMVNNHSDPALVALASGKILIAGGADGTGPAATAELYDPATHTWSATASMLTSRYDHRAVLVPDGRVLIVGGGTATEVYDPVTSTFTASGPLNVGRTELTANVLPSGKVLVTAGYADSVGSEVASAELWDPVTGTFTFTGSLATARRFHTSTTLADGSVLVVGGQTVFTAERYTPASGTWSTVPSPTYGPGREAKMVTLKDGRALVAGGRHAGDAFQFASLYDPQTNSWSAATAIPGSGTPFVSSDCCTPKSTPGCDNPILQNQVCATSGNASCCSTAWGSGCVDTITTGPPKATCGRRAGQDMLVLPNGSVLFAAGQYAISIGSSIEDPRLPLLYLPTPQGPGSWVVTSDKTIDPHEDGRLAALPDGNALLAGGDFAKTSRETCFTQGCACVLSAECLSGNCVDGFCCDTECSGTCSACSAALKGQGTNGACGPVAANSDPENECTEAAPTSCSTDGFCNGAGACQLYASGTKCGPSSCIDGISENHPNTCDGTGTCVVNGSGPCPGGYVCVGDACLTSCVTGADCQEHYNCVNGSCKRLPNGQPCSDGIQCDSDQCVDGVCCNDACDGQCEACDVSQKVGECTPVSGDPHGNRPACESSTSGDCASTCNGADPTACKLPGKEKTCGEGKSCDGKGACVQTAAICSADKTESTALDGTVTKCGLYACDTSTGECGTSCSTSSQCAKGAVCDQPKCIPSDEGEADEGCGCDLAPTSSTGGALLGALFALGLWLRRRSARSLAIACAAFGVLGCSSSEKDEAPAPVEPVSQKLDELAARFPAARLLDAGPRVFGRSPMRVSVGRGFAIEDVDSSLAVSVELEGAATTGSRVGHSTWLGQKRGPEGSDVLVRTSEAGVEDFVVFERAPRRGELAYRIDVTRVAGLRLVEGVLEFLDETGSPRLAVARPWTLDAHGVRRDASLALEGCAADHDPRVPFDRPVTPPNATTCKVSVMFATDVSYPLLVDPSWTATTSASASNHGSTVLQDGRLLIAGGPSISAKVYQNGAWTITGSMAVGRSGLTLTTLDNGLALATGGGSATAELYNPATGTWSQTASPMASSRVFSGATKLADGSVLVTGGDATGSVERYIPASSTFQAAGSLGSPRYNHTATLLADGRVLVAGGGDGSQVGSTTAVVYTPGTGWAATGNMNVAHGVHVAARLADGRVLVAGGDDGFAGQIADAELWNPTTGTWTLTNAMPDGKRFARAVAFAAEQKVYVIAGRANGASTFLFDVATTTWSDGGNLNTARWTHSADLLPDGTIVVVGGLPSGGPGSYPTEYQCVEIGCACSATTPCIVGSCVDGVCCQTACDGTCEACNAAGKTSGPNGVCGPAVEGSTDPACAAEPVSTCGNIGTCDGAGACKKQPLDTECAAASCTGPVQEQAVSKCDGLGTCVTPPVATCEPGYPCTGTACATSCVTNDDCIAPYTCQNSLCAKKPNGAECTALTECASDFCVDGRCCDVACNGQCQSCAETGLEGVCTAIAGEPKGDRDPCTGTGTTCGGTCELTSPEKCTYPTGSCGDGKTCSNGACVATANVCVDGNTASQPATGPKTPCAPYYCAEGECQTSCTTSQDCVKGYVCDEKLCVTANPPAVSEDDGGCGCRTSPSDTRAWVFVLAGFLAMLRRRRR